MSPFSTTTVPWPSATAQCCIWQIHKKAEGERFLDLGAPYGCDTGEVSRGVARLRVKLASAGAPCDQDPLPIPDGSRLEARGSVVRRVDGLTDFTGRFTIVAPTGQVLFRGAIELFDRIGTHHAPFGTEPCNPQSHVEGWLVGAGNATVFPNHMLRALFVARGEMPKPGGPYALLGSLDGVLLKCP
jgi:hypothetical protein